MSALVSVSGRVAVITGASRGLGAGLARAFAARGLRLGLCARGESALDDSDDISASRLDVGDAAAMERFAEQVVARLGPVDLWINNAGVLEPIAPLRDVKSADLLEHLRINVLGVFHGTQAYVRHLRDAGRGGVLINVSSGAARRPYEGWSAYCAAKAAVDRLTECVALEESASGLRAYAIAPGLIDTQMQAQIRAAGAELFPEHERFVERKRRNAFSTPEFVAERLLEIAFDAGSRPEGVLVRLPDG